MRVLIVEDDREVARNIAKMLRECGHVADAAHDGEDGLALAREGAFDVLIVDRMMPRRDGLSMISALREEGDKTPVLILSALGEVDDRVEGLKAGGDDYLVKPYAPSELIARVDALARRRNPDAVKTRLEVGDLEMDLLARTVKRGGEAVLLQPREFRLLEFLMRNAGQVVTRTMLLEKVWDYHFDPQTNVIDVHISRLRAKIDKPFSTSMLHTVRGAGYRLQP
ncbi:response regulator transcription factor [Hyphomonadaceae bacterium BL14]|nr:response regulator transcription factor [Hyphomonadaceae bacterium BL14]